MPGMGTGLNENDPTIVSAFHAALLRQFLVVLLILAVRRRGVERTARRAVTAVRGQAAGAAGDKVNHSGHPAAGPLVVTAFIEAPGRRLLRVSFGLIWIFDGLLQGQASMPLGMAPQVIGPAAVVSPGWVQRLDNDMATIWSFHPIAAPAAAVWIQIGIGVWLIAAARGDLSRLAGLASVGWGLVVWVFGEAFGEIFAPGLTWLFGAPGAVLFYCVAGVLIALPFSAWATPRSGRADHKGSWPVLRGDGHPSSVAGARLLAGHTPGRSGRDAHGHGPADGPDSSAPFVLVVGNGVRSVRCGPRLGRQPLCRPGPGVDRGRFPHGRCPES